MNPETNEGILFVSQRGRNSSRNWKVYRKCVATAMAMTRYRYIYKIPSQPRPIYTIYVHNTYTIIYYNIYEFYGGALKRTLRETVQ